MLPLRLPAASTRALEAGQAVRAAWQGGRVLEQPWITRQPVSGSFSTSRMEALINARGLNNE